MRVPSRYFAGAALAAVAVFVAAAFVQAETCKLEIKRLDPQDRSRSSNDDAYRSTSAQYFFSQLIIQGKTVNEASNNPQQVELFKKIVKKEPQYESEHPFRGVAKLGSQEFAFVLDTILPKPDEKEAEKAKAEEKEKAEKEKKAEEKKEQSAVAGLADQISKALTKEDKPKIKLYPYNRLYFDLNCNGDLTDDKPIDVEPPKGSRAKTIRPIQSFTQIQFPRVDLTIDVDGTKVDYSFFLSGYLQVSPEYSYSQIMLNAGAYREGDITLDGKKRHVVLIDYNTDGRFNSEMKIHDSAHGRNGELYPQEGDMLLVDLDITNPGSDSPYDVASSNCRHYLSKMVNLDGVYYDVKVTPAGDELTLTPSSAALGNVTNPNDGYSAVIYGDNGFLKIKGNKGTQTPVPEGQWKLLSYTINQMSVKKEEKKPEEKKEEGKEGSLLDALSKKLESAVGGAQAAEKGPRPSMVAARATVDYKPVKVVKGETVELPFGPPYKPTVTAEYYSDGERKQLSLGMSLIGSAGEICSNMMVNGGRPAKPKFTITDAQGKVVQEGSFEYG